MTFVLKLICLGAMLATYCLMKSQFD